MPRRPNPEVEMVSLGHAIVQAVGHVGSEAGNYDMPIYGLRHEQWTEAEDGLPALLQAAAASSDRRVRAASDALDEEFEYVEGT